MNRRFFWIAFSCIIAFITVSYIIFTLSFKSPYQKLNKEGSGLINDLSSIKAEYKQKENNNLKSTIFTEERISPNCNLVVETYYNKCGHTLIQNKPVPNDLVNFTEAQLKLAYKDYDIISFSPNQIKLETRLDEKCPQHYILKDKEGRVTVFYQNPINNISIKKETNILVERLPQNDIERLKKGIEINSDEELAYFLEDLGS